MYIILKVFSQINKKFEFLS